MPLKNPNRFESLPGSYYALKTDQLFPSDNEWGIPTIRRTTLADTPAWLAPYRTRIRSQRPLTGAYHFFIDDHRFESVWNRPNHAISALKQLNVALSPDFSLYRDWPLCLQLWNVYRNRWCGAYWQSQGITVIPTISWSTPESYPFAFAGIEKNSLVAISTVGSHHDRLSEHYFLQGLREMIRQFVPSRILCYGPAPPGKYHTDIMAYPTRWKGIRDALKKDN